MGKGTAIPYTETTCCPSASIWNKENIKVQLGEMDTVVHWLQYHMRVMCCQLTGQLRVNWRVFLIHLQNSTKHSTWGLLGQTVLKALNRQWHTSSTKAKLKSDEEPTTISGWTFSLVPSIVGFAYASAFTLSHTCTSSWYGIPCKDFLFEPQQICPP